MARRFCWVDCCFCQFGYRGVQAGNVFAQLGERALGVAQLAAGLGDGFFLLTQLILQRAALLLLLAYRTLFGGDIGLNGFQLVAVIRRLGGDAAHSKTPALNALAHMAVNVLGAVRSGSGRLPAFALRVTLDSAKIAFSLMGRDYSTMNSGLPVISCGIGIPISDNMVGAMSESLPPSTAFTGLSPT